MVRVQRGRSAVSVLDLIRQGLLRPGQELTFRQTDTKAVVTHSGSLVVEGIEFKSPSSAAKAVTEGASTNGWTAWFVSSESGLKSLAVLRGLIEED